MTDTNNAEFIWNTYAASWSIADEHERSRVLADVLSEGVEYTDPNTRTSGRAALSAYMAAFQEQAPGARFRQDSFRFRSGESLAEWSMVDPAGEVLTAGISYGRFDDDGRLVKMAGFFPR